MGLLRGADSAEPQPTHYKGFGIWGIYVAGDTPHVWSHEEVAATADEGVWGILPIVVPQQGVIWWDQAAKTFDALVSQAKAWGVPPGSPLCLDLEADQADAIGDTWRPYGRRWALACYDEHYVPWLYAPHTTLLQDDKSVRWLSGNPGDLTWPVTLPSGVEAWQYATSADNGAIDLDAFPAGRTYMPPKLPPAVTAGGPLAPVLPTVTPPDPVDGITLTELGDEIATLWSAVEGLYNRLVTLETGEKTAPQTEVPLEVPGKVDPTYGTVVPEKGAN